MINDKEFGQYVLGIGTNCGRNLCSYFLDVCLYASPADLIHSTSTFIKRTSSTTGMDGIEEMPEASKPSESFGVGRGSGWRASTSYDACSYDAPLS